MHDSQAPDSVRLDQWLWAARFFRTRPLARQAVGAGLTARGLPEEPPPAPQKKTVTKKEKN